MDEEIRKPEGMSVGKIATIAVILIILGVCLAVALYIIPGNDDFLYRENRSPLGLTQVNRTETSITLRVASANDDAFVDGTTISLMNDSEPQPIEKASLMNSGGLELGWYTPSTGWNYVNGSSADDLAFIPGMSIRIINPDGFSLGDRLYFTSDNAYYWTTIFEVR